MVNAGDSAHGAASREGRIPLPELEQLSPEQRQVYEEVVNGPRGRLVGPLRAVIHSPQLAVRWSRIGEFLRFDSCVPERQRELAIVMIGRRWTSHLEWAIHSNLARAAGIAPEVLEAIRAGRAPVFDNEDDAAVYEFTRQLQQTGAVDLPTYRSIADRWGTVGLVELTAIVGYFTMVAMMLNAHQIPVPPGEDSDLEVVATPTLQTLPPALVQHK